MKVLSHHSLLYPVGPEREHPPLEPLITRWSQHRVRRIDRYIQLCLAGGLNCVAGRSLPDDTGVYMATRVGAVGTSAATMVQTEQRGLAPKPVHFVNTLGNSAGYYLTKLLGIEGRALVLSQEYLSFEAALLHAWLDLHQGRVGTALVGGFDEAPAPFAHQLERLEAPEDSPLLSEGSHWLLLEGEGQGTGLGRPEWLNDREALTHWLARQPAFDRIQTCFTPTDAEQTLLEKAGKTVAPFEAPGVPHGTFSGAALVALCEAYNRGGPCLHLARGPEGPYCAVITGL